MEIRSATFKNILIPFLLFSVLFALRLFHMNADPPKTLDPVSIGHLSDPGGYVFNARNKIVFDTWEIDEWNLMYVTPLTHFITYLVFLALGVGISQMNVVPIVFSCLILVFVYLILKKSLNQTFALIGILLLGINFQFTMFSRIAVRVMPMLFFAVLTVYLLMTIKKKTYMYFLAGVVCFISFTIKGTFLLILPSVLLGLLFYDFFQSEKNRTRVFLSFGAFIAGMAVVFIAWYILFNLPNKELFQDFAQNNFNWLTPDNLPQAFKNFWTRSLSYFMAMPVQTLLCSLFLPFLFFKAVKYPKKVSLIAWISGFWVISNFLYSSIIYYKPWRHLVALVPPIVLLSVMALYEFLQTKSIGKPEKVPFLMYPFLFFWFLFPISALIILKSKPITLDDMLAKSFWVLGVSCSLVVIIAIWLRFWPRDFSIRLPMLSKKIILFFLIAASLFYNLRPYSSWALSPRHDIKNLSQDLGRAFDHMTIGGLIAPLISLENKHKGHAYHTGYINKGLDFLEKYNITHLFILNYFNEKKVYEHDFPDAMKNAKLIARYPLWKGYFEFFDLFPAPSKTQEDIEIIEGEIFFGEGGIPRFDAKASNNFAFVAEKNENALIQYPMTLFPPGNYSISFTLQVVNEHWEKEDRVKIDIADPKRRRVLATKTLLAQNFQSSSDYQDFFLSLSLKKTEDIVLRVYKTEKMTVRFDKVTILRTESVRQPSGQ
jgi:4-amino-4-deoxy-L-arabinose transferase-like glycosyltransferase